MPKSPRQASPCARPYYPAPFVDAVPRLWSSDRPSTLWMKTSKKILGLTCAARPQRGQPRVSTSLRFGAGDTDSARTLYAFVTVTCSLERASV